MRTAILIVMLLGSGKVMQAQATGWPNTRRGWWIGAGVGDGSARFDCTFDFCGSERHNALSGYIRSGFTLSPHWLVGGEITGWFPPGDLTQDEIWSASFVALWYPSRTGAWHLKLGMGGLWYRSTARVADVGSMSADAPSATLGVGIEVRASRNLSLVPWVQVLASPTVPLHYSSVWFTDWPPSPPEIRINVVQVGLGVTLH